MNLSLANALRAKLLSSPSISSMVGGNRVYPQHIPQGIIATSIVYNRITSETDFGMSGPSGLARSRIQIDCWATTNLGAATLADLVKTFINGTKGTWSYSGGSVVVQGCFMRLENERFDSEAKMYSVSRDYEIIYQES